MDIRYEESGGITEVLTLPFVVAIPGTILATIGSALGKGLSTHRGCGATDKLRN